MKFVTVKLLDSLKHSSGSNWIRLRQAEKAYKIHLDSIYRLLPPSVQQMTEYCFHDAGIIDVEYTGSSLILTFDGRDECCSVQGVFQLIFIDVTQCLVNGRDLLYDEDFTMLGGYWHREEYHIGNRRRVQLHVVLSQGRNVDCLIEADDIDFVILQDIPADYLSDEDDA